MIFNLSYKSRETSHLVGWDRRMHVGWEGRLGDHSVRSQTVGWWVEAAEQTEQSVSSTMSNISTMSFSHIDSIAEFLWCPAGGGALQQFEFLTFIFIFFLPVGAETVSSPCVHTTHPFCKAVGSYASVIPPWENNTQDSEPVRSCKPQCRLC